MGYGTDKEILLSKMSINKQYINIHTCICVCVCIICKHVCIQFIKKYHK